MFFDTYAYAYTAVSSMMALPGHLCLCLHCRE